MSRALAWRNWCHKQGLECHLDIDGSTKWGKAAFRGLDAIAIPLNNIDAFEGTEKQKTHAIERVHKLTQVGVLSLVYRRKGRLYHALSSLRGTTRERCLMHYEGRWHAVAEADVHACFWSVLASRVGCPDLIKALQKREFYSSLRGDFEGSDGDLKVEVQRQCLFWRDARLSERPIWRRLCRLYPLLATLITKLRRQNGVTDLAAFLMRSEAKTMVDGVLPSINFPAVGLHDGVLTPSSCAASAAQTISKLARADWGFAPAVRAK
ncbi:MAG TPA: hypothetical protein DDW52_14945 [Planctomycetaceae bacterium]|nr:hypothetical protein [Planctomycetaceae bacterium]